MFQSISRKRSYLGERLPWGAPQWTKDLGGQLAVWCEQVVSEVPSRPVVWLVLHGGPGGRCSPVLVEPLRRAEANWLAFDQRNSGLSEDLPLHAIDTQRFVDDAVVILDALDLEHVCVLGGSWGATLAIELAAHYPARVSGLVLRAPFLPFRRCVDAFFAELEYSSPQLYAQTFGLGMRTVDVCEKFLGGNAEQQLLMAHGWSQLELSLLGRGANAIEPIPTQSSAQQALLRKYTLQAHFLAHDCFITPKNMEQDCARIQSCGLPVTIVQGLDDRVCPPSSAQWYAQHIAQAELIEVPALGHLPDQPIMIDRLAEACKSMRWRTKT